MADRCTCRVESCGCVMTSGCKMHGQRIEPPSSKGPCGCDDSLRLTEQIVTLRGEIEEIFGLATDDAMRIDLIRRASEQSRVAHAERDAMKARVAELEAENAGLRAATERIAERPAKLEAGIRAYAETCLSRSVRHRHLRDGLLELLEASNG